MDQRTQPDRSANESGGGGPFPPPDEANEADVLDQASAADPDDDAEVPASRSSVEANEADVAEQAMPVADDDDGRDRDRDPRY